MGTHAVIRMRVKDAATGLFTCWCAVYIQFDGDEVGAQLAALCRGLALVNGIPYPRDPTARIANGPGCLFAQLVAALKQRSGVGNVYLVAPNHPGAEYVYHVDVDEAALTYRHYQARPVEEEMDAAFAALAVASGAEVVDLGSDALDLEDDW
jgi:hypothetical protein